MANPLKNNVIWITGASTGIGAACAREFVRRGARVAVSARSEEKLADLQKELGEEFCFSVPLDVTDSAANKSAVATVKKRFGRIDRAFLNAGTWEPMDLPKFDAELFEKTFRVNVMGMMYGIEAVLPELLANKGHLIGMSSSVAYRGIPRAEAYCASKAAIRATLQALRCQLKPRSVPVTVILPGFVKSPLTDTNDFDMPFLMETEAAARVIVEGVARKKTEIAFPLPFILILKAMQLLPDSIYTSIMSKKMVRS